jgi:hypothetical protein
MLRRKGLGEGIVRGVRNAASWSNERLRRNPVVATRPGKGLFTHPLLTSIIVQHKPVAC